MLAGTASPAAPDRHRSVTMRAACTASAPSRGATTKRTSDSRSSSLRAGRPSTPPLPSSSAANPCADPAVTAYDALPVGDRHSFSRSDDDVPLMRRRRRRSPRTRLSDERTRSSRA